MSETTTETVEQEWPEDCELCGTRLETGFVELAQSGEHDGMDTPSPGETVAQDFCPNPDCPGKDSGAAQATDQRQVPATQRADDAEAPGSLGGDNGGG
jgi:hypothetical protein